MTTVKHTSDCTTLDNLNAPWSLRFERDGTEDIAVISDANDDELLRSREFWLSEGDDPVPPTLAAMQLIVAAPALFAGCRMVIDRWEHGDLAEAARVCQTAINLATTDAPPWKGTDAGPAGNKPYSVLLLYPDYANDGGTETYYGFVEAKGPIEAVALAQRQAASAQQGIEIEPEDFAPLLVTCTFRDFMYCSASTK